ncbi:MAG TPA: acetyltransferase [Bryobacteraceae bacterium]
MVNAETPFRWLTPLRGAAILLCPLGLQAQAPMGVALRVPAADLAILETREVRKDLACTVTPDKPELGFDLRFHGGFDVSVPLSELSGPENQLTILFRVTPDLHKDQPRYFFQHIHVPEIADDAKGDANLRGMVDLGEGSYHVDWLMRDRSERVCSFYWDSDAVLPPKDKQIELNLPPGTVERMAVEQFGEEPPVERAQAAPPLNIKVLVNFAPQYSDAAALRPIDTIALVTMLRRIAREPQFGKFSLVAFNIQEQRVLYRQSSADKIDFPALGDAVHHIKLGTVDVKHLAQKHGESEFLTDLIKREVAAGGDHPDAVIIAGPKIMMDDSVAEDQIRPLLTDVDFPVFYVNYNLYPQDMPFKDSVSHAVKLFRGTEYTISRPRDLWFSVTDLVSRIVKSRHGRTANPGASQ